MYIFCSFLKPWYINCIVLNIGILYFPSQILYKRMKSTKKPLRNLRRSTHHCPRRTKLFPQRGSMVSVIKFVDLDHFSRNVQNLNNKYF